MFTKIPDRVITVKEDSTASIVCEAFGFPPPIIQWSRAFSSLPQGRSVVVNGTLNISRFSLHDTGSYQCKATNKLGSVATTTTLYFKRKMRDTNCLPKRDKISRFIYLYQVSYINVKISMHMLRFAYVCNKI